MAGKIQMVDTADDDKVERGAYKIGSPIPPIKPLKKLIVLDLNGLLARTIYRFQNLPFLNQRKPDGIFGSKLVFKRPFCDEFLQFCFSKFEVGLWSTIEKHNVDAAIDFVMGDWKHKLLFTWYQSDSSDTGFKTLGNDAKPLFLKELKKLWENENSSLPWSKGQFSSSNTLLIDDAPYTALKNPPNTAIFPHPYLVEHIHDNSIGPNGDLRAYLECLSVASNVPAYVEAHPFGQKAITATHPNWNFYSKIIKREREMTGVAEAQNRVSGRGPPPQMRGGPPPRPRFKAVDREKTCPLLLRVFTMIGRHHTKEDFAVRGKEPKDEVQIYTWKDATLRELTDLVKEVAPEARRRDAKLSFAFVYPDKNGRYVVRPVGMTHSYGIGRRPDDGKALAELSFQIGDYLDVAII